MNYCLWYFHLLVSDDKDARPVEVRILEYIKNNPKEALHNTDREWVQALWNMGIVIPFKNKVNWYVADSILKKLKDFAGLNAIVTDVVTQWTLGESYSNFSNYIDMVLYNGGFENMVRSWSSRTETALEKQDLLNISQRWMKQNLLILC